MARRRGARKRVFTDRRCPGVRVVNWGGGTFNVFQKGCRPGYPCEGGWSEVDVFTYYGKGSDQRPTYSEARSAAKRFFTRCVKGEWEY